MKIEMRRQVARLPFEEKINRVAQLIQLATKLKRQRGDGSVEDAADSAWLGKRNDVVKQDESNSGPSAPAVVCIS